MSKVVAGITISLDGYITGPNDRLGAGLGDEFTLTIAPILLGADAIDELAPRPAS